MNSNYNKIIDNNITDNNGGIQLLYFSGENNVISNNISYNNKFGILIHASTGVDFPCDDNTIIGNNITHNGIDGIFLVRSSNNNITGNNISHNGDYGLHLYAGSNINNITNNEFFNNTDGGIYLRYSSDWNNITDNTINQGNYGIDLNHEIGGGSCVNNTFINNKVINVNYSIYIGKANNNKFYSTNITNPEVYGIFINRNIEANYANFIPRNNTVNGDIIYYFYDEHNLIFNATESLAHHKVTSVGKYTFYACNNIIITNKTISNGTIGIFIHSSDNITLDDNTMVNMAEVGLHVENGYWHYITQNNTVDGEPIYYYTNITDITVTNLNLDTWNVTNVGKITMAYCTNVNLKNNNVSNNDYGIFLYGSKDITMWNNTMDMWNNTLNKSKLAGLFVENGFHHYISQNNTANDTTIYYFTDINGSEGAPINHNFSLRVGNVSSVGLITYVNSSYIKINNSNLHENYGSGVFVVDSFNISVEDNTAYYNCDGMVLRSSRNITLTNNIFMWNYNKGYGKLSGLHLMYNNEGNYIGNNTLPGNGYGIYIESSDNDEISYMNYNIYGNSKAGIYLDHSSPHIHNNSFTAYQIPMIEAVYSHPIIDGNHFIGPGGGIGIYRLSYCNDSAKIINNTFEDYGLAAIYLLDSSSPEIIDNTISNITRGDGITVYHGNSAPYIYNNIISNIDYFGIQLEDANATIENNRIHDVSEGINVNTKPPLYLESDKSNAKIIGNTIWNVYKPHSLSTYNAGINFAGYSIGIIKNNTIYNCTNSSESKGYGLLVHYDAIPSEISGNNFSYNDYGMVIHGSQDNLTVNNNTIIENLKQGIDFQGASRSVIVENNNISNNNKGIEAWNSDCQIKDNDINGNVYGIFVVGDGSSPLISNNTIEQNTNGINITEGSSTVINNNYISWSGLYGIYIQDSTNSTIFHNNLINNTIQTYDNTNNSNQWDNGYPSGGNYWSDYNGSDNYKGPGQNISGSDGIGDTPYVIDADSQDNYPLMDPWSLVHNIDKDLWYFTIQNAVDEADAGNTLEAMMGTYQENVVVNKTLTITGKYGVTRTIIDGGGSEDVVYITANWVNITGFSVTGSGSNIGNAGIELDNANNCIISNNTVHNNSQGIVFKSSSNNTISNNTIELNTIIGININSSNDNNVKENYILNNTWGINITQSSSIIIDDNSILNNFIGLYSYISSLIIRDNNISNNFFGIGSINYSNAIIGNNTINHNEIGIVNTYYSNGTINNNTISYNTYGISSASSSSDITFNNITNNSIGIDCMIVEVTLLGSDPGIHWNNIDNSDYNLMNTMGDVNLSATNNWWGNYPPDPPDSSKIMGDVDYSSWETAPIESAGPQ